MTLINNQINENFNSIILKKLKKGQIVRIRFIDSQNKEFTIQGKIIRVHKIGKVSTLSIEKKLKGIIIQVILPIYAPFILSIKIIQDKNII